jgi:hypothetical protein
VDTSVESLAKPDKPGKKSGIGKGFASILSAVLWTLGFFLAFVFPPNSPWIWLPDTLLLLGFFPLLLIWNPAWPWIAFGVLNVMIGFVLEVAKYLPDDKLPGEMPLVREHLAEFHVPWVWFIVGAVSVVYGIFRRVKGLTIWFMSRRKQKGSS